MLAVSRIVRFDALAKNVTTDTTSGTTTLPPGAKTFYGEVIGTGAVTQTQAIYGCMTSSAVNGLLLATITLTDTTRDQDATPVATANFPFYYVITTNTTGTGATGNVYAIY